MNNKKNSIKESLKTIISILLNIICFYFISPYIPFFQLTNIYNAIIIIIGLTLINRLIWPILSYYSLPFLVFTFGLGTLILNGVIIWIISKITSGIIVTGLGIIILPFMLTFINTAITYILDIDNESMYYRNILKKLIERNNPQNNNKKPGFIFLEIDGLAKPILEKAIKQGDMPTLKSWMDNKNYKLTSWQTDLSSQTSASQAGILHGNNRDIPAFRWVEKENGNKIVSSNNIRDAPILEEKISNGEGLLSCNGASRSNLFSGDAKDVLFTYSKLNIKLFYTDTWYYIYSSPYNFARIITLSLWEIILELASQIRQKIKDINPRIFRKPPYLIARAGANVILREITTYSLIGDIIKGDYNLSYSTYMGYDEIAHHSGIEDYDSFYALRQIDKQFKHLEEATETSKRKYHFIVLSDHGQSNGPTFKQKYNITLSELVKQLLPENMTIHSILHSNDDHFKNEIILKEYRNKKFLNEKLEDTKEHINIKTNETKKRLNLPDINIQEKIFNDDKPMIERIKDITNEYGIKIDSEQKILKNAETIVLASGNLGLIYFTNWSHRLSYEQIEDACPGLIKGLSNHPGIGFIMVNSDISGPIILSNDNIYYLNNDTYTNKNPLLKFGKNTADHLRRTNNFKHVPDILVNSEFDENKNEVYAFEELIGSHGGLGGYQTEPFILYPPIWNIDEDIIGAEEVNKVFKREIKKVWENKN